MLRIVNSVISLIFLVTFIACSNIKMLSPEEIYSAEFLKKIETIQLIYKDGDKKSALSRLKAMNDTELSQAEYAKKYNLIGIIFFSEQNYDIAIENFEMARSKVRIDRILVSQVYLNLASSFYKKDLYEKAYSYLSEVDQDVFSKNEKVNYYKLKLVLAQQLDKPKDIVQSIIPLLDKKMTFRDLEDSDYKEILVDNYRKLSSSERNSSRANARFDA